MENVWEYPRPPALVACDRRVRVEHRGVVVADSVKALRVLETSHPPGIYIAPEDVRLDLLAPSEHRTTFCEFKGVATYLDAEGSPAAAWVYRDPSAPFAALIDHVSFYPGRVDACFLGDEQVRAQESTFYGGWITDDITGPFKGPAGTGGW